MILTQKSTLPYFQRDIRKKEKKTRKRKKLKPRSKLKTMEFTNGFRVCHQGAVRVQVRISVLEDCADFKKQWILGWLTRVSTEFQIRR